MTHDNGDDRSDPDGGRMDAETCDELIADFGKQIAKLHRDATAVREGFDRLEDRYRRWREFVGGRRGIV